MRVASAYCLLLLRQLVWRAFSRACANTGKRIAASIAIIAITTRSSMSVKPDLRLFVRPFKTFLLLGATRRSINPRGAQLIYVSILRHTGYNPLVRLFAKQA